MITSTKDNYIRWSGNGDNFKVEINPLPNKFDNIFVEACKLSQEIYDLKTGKLHLFYSGGIDSEFALKVFLHLGMEITPVIVKLNPDYNSHDTDYAFKFCRSKGLEPLVIDIDFDHFVKSGRIVDIAKRLKTAGYPRIAVAHAISKVNGTVILADHEPTIKKNDKDEWDIIFTESDHVLSDYLINEGIDGTLHWHSWTPEMFITHLAHPCMQQLARNEIPGKLSSRTSRLMIYNEYSGFNLEERYKYHGWEKIVYGRTVPMSNTKLNPHPLFYHDSFKEIEKLRKDYDGSYSIDYFDFLKKHNITIGKTNV